jgi:hypothetical protein
MVKTKKMTTRRPSEDIITVELTESIKPKRVGIARTLVRATSMKPPSTTQEADATSYASPPAKERTAEAKEEDAAVEAMAAGAKDHL